MKTKTCNACPKARDCYDSGGCMLRSGLTPATKVRPNEETEGLVLKAIRLTLDKAAEACRANVCSEDHTFEGRGAYDSGCRDSANVIRSLSPEDILEELRKA